MEEARQSIIEFLKKETGIDNIDIEIPPNSEMGDYAFPCFHLAKVFKKNPNEIAKELSEKFRSNEFLSEAKALGPYLNFFINKSELAESTLRMIMKLRDRYGSSGEGKNKKFLVEHTSINPNAPPHVGRARNAIIGDSVVRILRFQGYKVDVHYFVNDVGKQIAMLVLGARKKKKVDFNSLLEIYIGINKKAEENPEIEKDVLEILNRLEKGDKKIRHEFKKIVDVCIRGQRGILAELGIKYNYFDYESKYLWNKKTEEVIKKIEKTGKLFLDGYNRWVLDQKGYGLGMEMPVLVLTRNDGTSLYPLRDIAYTLEKLKSGENIIILGEDQKLYFEQISCVLKELELKPFRAVHYSFVLLQEGKMSTRKGNLVLLEDFMKEAVKKASIEIKKRHNKSSSKAAKAIGYGALKYGILKVSPEKSVMFDWEQALSFEGDTAPYMQYAYARIKSILHKKKIQPSEKNFADKLGTKEDMDIIKHLSIFPAVVKKATDELRPHLIANYSYSLAQKFNEYYHIHQILKSDEKTTKARIILISCIAYVIENSLGLLGIEVLDKM